MHARVEEPRGGSVPACPRRTRGRGVRPAGLSPRNGGCAGRKRRPPACGPANAEDCGRATASAAGRLARCGVVRAKARKSVDDDGLGLTARGAGMVRRRCGGGEPGRPVAQGSVYGVRARERVVRSVEAQEAERRRRWPTRGLRCPRVEAAVSRRRTKNFGTDGLWLTGAEPGWRYLRAVGPELRWGRWLAQAARQEHWSARDDAAASGRTTVGAV